MLIRILSTRILGSRRLGRNLASLILGIIAFEDSLLSVLAVLFLVGLLHGEPGNRVLVDILKLDAPKGGVAHLVGLLGVVQLAGTEGRMDSVQ